MSFVLSVVLSVLLYAHVFDSVFSWRFTCLHCQFFLAFLHFFACVVGLSVCRLLLSLFISLLNHSIPSFISVFSNAFYVVIALFSVCRSFVVLRPILVFLPFFLLSVLISVFRCCFVTSFCRSLLLSCCVDSFFLWLCLSFFISFFLSFIMSVFPFVRVLSSCSFRLAFLYCVLSFFRSFSNLSSCSFVFCFCLSVSFCLPFLLSFLPYFSLSLFLSFCLSLSLSLFLSFFLCFCRSVFLSSFLAIFVSFVLCIFLPFFLPRIKLKNYGEQAQKTYGEIIPEPPNGAETGRHVLVATAILPHTYRVPALWRFAHHKPRWALDDDRRQVVPAPHGACVIVALRRSVQSPQLKNSFPQII